MKTALSIAGSDCSGGAGIQADLKTMTACGVYGMTAITALTAQNTVGVTGILNADGEFLEKQLDAVFDDIRPDAVKTGMIPTPELVRAAAGRLEKYGAENIVVDPVMISTSGARLIGEDAAREIVGLLFPLASLVTPNIPEAEAITGLRIQTADDMLTAAEKIRNLYGCAVLLKGGHLAGNADDLLCLDGGAEWLRGKRINNPNTHGTGCTLSAAIASYLAAGCGIYSAAVKAKEYVRGALSAMLDLGSGSGPLNHAYEIIGRQAEKITEEQK